MLMLKKRKYIGQANIKKLTKQTRLLTVHTHSARVTPSADFFYVWVKRLVLPRHLGGDQFMSMVRLNTVGVANLASSQHCGNKHIACDATRRM